MGIFLSFVGRLIMQEFDASLPTQLAIAVGGLALFVALAAVHAWYDGRRGKRPTVLSPVLAEGASADRH